MQKPARTRLSPDDRRAQLLDHAVACFADHGIARATQAQVAARAGVSVSAVYSYFRTRADLVTVVLDNVASTIAAMVVDALAAPASPVEALLRLATRTADLAVDRPDVVRVWLDWSSGVRADVWPQFLVLQQQLQLLVAGELTRISPDAPAATIRSAARLFVGGAHTLALMRFENVGAADRAIFIDQMVGGTVAALRR
jgi:TetR/AcrR family hemagglutinin/protease transcriptional regulator